MSHTGEKCLIGHSRDHVTLPNSEWRQYLHSLFIPVERRLIAAKHELQMHNGYF